MLDQKIIEQLKQAGFTLRPREVDHNVIPMQTYWRPTVEELINSLSLYGRNNDQKTYFELKQIAEGWKAKVYLPKTTEAIGDHKDRAIANLYIKVHG